MANYDFIKACYGDPVSRTPVWFMRQAGRYLPEYRAVRKNYSFLEMCKKPEVACEVTIQPIDIIGTDAAIMFSDILVPFEPMGLDLDFNPAPVIANPIRSREQVDSLRLDAAEEVGFVYDAIKLIKRELESRQVPLIGFCGAPFTLACYAVEGSGSKNYPTLKEMMYSDPALFSDLMRAFVVVQVDYLNRQIDAGVDALQIFDSWGGILSREDYDHFVLPHMKSLFSQLKRTVPIIFFIGNNAHLLESQESTGADVMGLDWRIPVDAARQRLGNTPVQGNLDPTLLFAEPQLLEKRVIDILRRNGNKPGFIFNLGHGITPKTPVDNVKLVVELVHQYPVGE
ncbi:uroporphyrinogen decarboxylase [Desulfurispira natronophila]|uniref:Uroporphyrinogen decarboxylase n=1 Tax=Desulfurispira natronophila TaxID=682562 RepID=A0A7W7Y6A6_9BACT|nr:uroporphyrinogen decarboxylase [Desulfurispira natronophila]MBB5022734.1 uroporphyrinogen decarboxylase [Desulfurispira natronophila]